MLISSAPLWFKESNPTCYLWIILTSRCDSSKICKRNIFVCNSIKVIIQNIYKFRFLHVMWIFARPIFPFPQWVRFMNFSACVCLCACACVRLAVCVCLCVSVCMCVGCVFCLLVSEWVNVCVCVCVWSCVCVVVCVFKDATALKSATTPVEKMISEWGSYCKLPPQTHITLIKHRENTYMNCVPTLFGVDII